VVEDAGGARMRHVDHGVLAVGEGGPVEARLAALQEKRSLAAQEFLRIIQVVQ